MNRNQAFALAIAAANLLVVLLFPPFDQYSIANSRVPIFAGFAFINSHDQYNVVNTGVLLLEMLVVAINTAIAWLLLSNRAGAPQGRRRVSYQNAVLVIVGFNLVLVLLFPPFESIFAMTNAAIPTFEGFYLILTRQPNHTIVATLLYLEVIFVLVNGALMWLMFRDRHKITAEEAYALASTLRAKTAK
jgi:hypothetical protein